MISLISYINTYWQPLMVFVIAIVLLLIVCFLNWYRNYRENIIQWIANKIFRNKPFSQSSAVNLFTVLTSILVAIALIWIGLALLYLHVW